MSSLRSTLEEKSKSINVLKNLIEKQQTRYQSEAKQFENEQQIVFDQLSKENNSTLAAVRSSAESWFEKNDSVQARINDLKDDISAAERDARERADATRQSISDTKRRAHAEHRQQQREREREWYEHRKAEIEKLTWKGMSSSIARLLQKHDEECSTIRYNMELSKQKLEAHFENETLERIQSFQHNEEQSNSRVCQKKKELADLLLQEYDTHNDRLLKLKKTLMQDEEALKKSQAQDIATMNNEHEAALTKIKSTLDSKLQLSKQSMLTQKGQIEQRHRTSLGIIAKELSKKKETWDKEYSIISNKRIAERNEQNRNILLQRREVEIKGIIRAGLEKERVNKNKIK